jgi:hypothetical protein
MDSPLYWIGILLLGFATGIVLKDYPFWVVAIVAGLAGVAWYLIFA